MMEKRNIQNYITFNRPNQIQSVAIKIKIVDKSNIMNCNSTKFEKKPFYGRNMKRDHTDLKKIANWQFSNKG